MTSAAALADASRPTGARGAHAATASAPSGPGPREPVWLLLPGGLRRREPLRADLHVALFGRCLHEGQAGLIEVWAARRDPGGRRLRPTTSRRDPTYFPPAGDLRALVRLARRHRDRGEEVFAAPVPRPRPLPGKGVVAAGRVVWVDLDDAGLIAGLGGLTLRPQLVVASGGGVHAYWKLTADLPGGELEAANRRLAARLGGDPQAVDRGRPMRLPGTINHKRGAWCRVLLCDLARPAYDPAALLAHLPADPQTPPAPPPRPPRRPAPTRDAAGVDVPADGGFVACPLPGHDERTPSCRVFAEPDRGFWCFGCGRGGRLYDLQSLLDGGPWGRELRGDAFLAGSAAPTRRSGSPESPAPSRRSSRLRTDPSTEGGLMSHVPPRRGGNVVAGTTVARVHADQAAYLREVVPLSEADFARATGTDVTTVQAWLAGSADPVGEHADRLLELAVIVQRLTRVLDADEIPGWLKAPSPSLDDQPPIDVLAHGGYRRVSGLLAGLYESPTFG